MAEEASLGDCQDAFPMQEKLSLYQLYVVITALALGGFAIGTAEFVAMGLIQEVAANMQVSVPQAGHMISAYALGVVVGAPTIAIVTARLPRKGLLLLLMLFYAIANFLSSRVIDFQWLEVSRFIAGLPHGAYFGVAALVAASLAGPEKRAQAVSQIMTGLTVATVLGVPFATWLGQHLGWRAGFEFAALMAALTVLAVWFVVPHVPVLEDAGMKKELAGLKNRQMWLTLGIAAIGGGGMFSVYTFVSPILTNYTQVSIAYVPLALSIWGIGMVIGGLAGGWLADQGMRKALYQIMFAMIVAFFVSAWLMQSPYTAFFALFVMGACGMSIGPALQTRLMDVAGQAQTLAATLNHAAFNVANAQGAWLGGVVVSAGLGWTAPVWVSVVLAIAGLVVLTVSMSLDRQVNSIVD